MNILNYEGFQNLIKSLLKKRENDSMKRKINVVAIPEIIGIFAKSQSVLISKGKSHYLMRDARRDLKLKNPEEEMKVDEKYDRNVEKLQSKILSLEEKINEYKTNQNDLVNDRGKLMRFYEERVINSDSEYIDK